MVSVNLLPATILIARRRNRRVRLWVTAGAMVVGLTAIPLAVDLTKTAQASSLEVRLRPLHTRLARVRGDLKAVAEQREELTTQLARADALRGKRPWADLLALISEKTPDTVWLTSLRTRLGAPLRPMEKPARTASSATAQVDAVVLGGPSGLHLEGYALDHESLYEFMSALKNLGVFPKVELTAAGKEPVLDGTAVRFVLECDW
jgi:Tfp pilus assembly protein PilN